MSLRYGLLLLACLSLAAPPMMLAQERPVGDAYLLDYAAAEVPASALLNPNADPVVRPGNVRKVTLAYQTTALQAGAAPLAVEWSPAQSLWKARNLEDWARMKSLYRVTVSGGFARFPNSASRLSWGLAWTPIDKSDPASDASFYRQVYSLQAIGTDSLPNLESLQQDWKDMILEVLAGTVDTAGPGLGVLVDSIQGMYPLSTHPYDTVPKPTLVRMAASVRLWKHGVPAWQVGQLYARLNGYFPEYFAASSRVRRGLSVVWRAELQRAQEAFRDRNWNRTALKLGVGGTVFASDGHIEGFRGERLTAFAAFATSLNGAKAEHRMHQFVFHAQYSVPVRRVSGRGDTLRNAFSLGMKFYFGDAQNRFLLQAVYTRLHSETEAGSRQFGFWQGRTGYEFRVVRGMFVSAEAGYTQLGSPDGAFLPIALVQVKYGLGGAAFGRR